MTVSFLDAGARQPDWRETKPGDVVYLDAHVRLESAGWDSDFSVGPKMVYCLCIARTTSETASGLQTLKVYLLTPAGVGYKRFNLGGTPRDAKGKTYRNWE